MSGDSNLPPCAAPARGDATFENGDANDASGDVPGESGDAIGVLRRALHSRHDAAELMLACAENKEFVRKFFKLFLREEEAAWRLVLDQPALLDNPQRGSRGQQAPWESMAGALEKRLPWVLTQALGELMLACPGSRLQLCSVALTTPTGGSIRDAASEFVDALEARGSSHGGLLALEPSRKGRDHLHGLVLTDDPAGIVRVWESLSGATWQANTARVVTGWQDHIDGLHTQVAKQVTGVLTYAFKPWPAEHGSRDLEHDVFSAGCFTGPWLSVLRSAPPEQPPKLPVSGKLCPLCDAPVERGVWCSNRCRSNAHHIRCRSGVTIGGAADAARALLDALVSVHGANLSHRKARRVARAFQVPQPKFERLLRDLELGQEARRMAAQAAGAPVSADVAYG